MLKDKMNQQRLALKFKELKQPKQLALCGLLVALYVMIYNMNIIITPIVQLRFGFLVIAIAGFVGGPIMGITVGAFGDLLSMFLTAGQGASFFFGFTLSYALMGLACGLIFYNSKITIPRVIAGGIAEFLISFLLNSKWLSILYGTTYSTQLIMRLPKCLVMLVINSVILYAFLKTFSVALRKSQLLA